MPWHPLVSAASVPAAGIVAIDVGDRQLVVWRTAYGEAVVCDARCPHQWSHLEGEGVVDGDELVCTAHFWRFDPEGHGTKLNVKGRRDDKSDVEVFASRELDGMIEADLPVADGDDTLAPPDGSDSRETGTPMRGPIVVVTSGPDEFEGTVNPPKEIR